MYKLLIVDDDDIIREGLEKNIAWAENGICLVGSAKDSREGFELAMSLCPDVILTDIKMPKEDGLDFARRVLENYPETKVVFLTAYEDFEYAKSALQLKVVDYILKFDGNQVVLEAVKRACKESKNDYVLSQRLKKSDEKLREEFFQKLFLGGISQAELLEVTHEFSLDFSGKHFCVCVFHIMDYSSFSAPSPYNEELLNYGLINICRELTQNSQDAYCMCFRSKITFLFMDIHPVELYSYVKSVLENILQNVKKYLNIALLIGVGCMYDDPQKIYRSYQDALSVLRFGKGGDDEILLAEEIAKNENTQELLYRDILSYIGDHCFDAHLSLKDIASSAFISSNYACTVFKKQTGQTINSYILQCRMKRAKELIISTNWMVYQVAEAVGYSNPRYFSMLFKKMTGLTPLEFREANQ